MVYDLPMNDRERQFCIEYAANPNAEQAALKAGYAASYSHKLAHLIIRRPHVIAEIQRLRVKMNVRAEKNATDVVNEYAIIAFTDRVGFLKPDPEFPGSVMYKAPDELTDDERALVERVTTTWRKVEREVDGVKKKIERQEYSYVLSDKANALQQMGRHFGIFDDKLRLQTLTKNPFSGATPEQLEQLKNAFVNTMQGGKLIDHKTGEVIKVNGSE